MKSIHALGGKTEIKKELRLMADELVLSNARIVLPEEVITGTLVLRDGRIAEVGEGPSRAGEDMAGDYIIPDWWSSYRPSGAALRAKTRRALESSGSGPGT